MEIDRFNFLVERDGLEAAIAFEERGSILYRIAMVECFSDSKSGTKGKEWAKIYCNAARECDEVLKTVSSLRMNN